MTISEILERDLWSLAEGEQDSKPVFIRFRGEFLSRPDIAGFPRMIRIVWPYEPDENGLPSLEVATDLRAFEGRMVEAVQPDGIALLVAAITHNGEREWLFYASELGAFERCLNACQEGHDPYPIDVSTASDPKWSALYDDILAGITEFP